MYLAGSKSTLEKRYEYCQGRFFDSLIVPGKNTPGRRQSKTSILSRNGDQKSIETVLTIAICRPTGDKWQSKTLFLLIFDPRSSIVDYVFDCRLLGVKKCFITNATIKT